MRKLAMDRGERLVQLAERIIDADQLLRPAG
jgi:AmiR/NasT family two-component response regulator